MTISAPQTFESDCRAIRFIDEGEGPVVVLLPARGLTIGSLGALASVLEEEGFRVVRIGVRRSAHGTDVTLHDLARDVVDVLDDLGLAKVWVAGHAFGGALARTVALDVPDRVEGVLLLGVAGTEPVTDHALHALRTAFSDVPRADAVEAMRVLTGDRADAEHAWQVFSGARDLEAGLLQSSALANTPPAEWSPLPARGPVLIIQGADDRVTVPANGELLRDSAPTRASIASIDGGGYLFPLTHPGEVGAQIEDYLGWD